MDYTSDESGSYKNQKTPLMRLNTTFNTIINNHNYNPTNPKNQPKPPKQPKKQPRQNHNTQNPHNNNQTPNYNSNNNNTKKPLKTHEPPIICFRNYTSPNFRGKGNNYQCTF